MSLANIAPALLKAQRNMSNAKKDAKNPFFKSKFADLNSVREAVTPALHEAGISILQLNVTYEGSDFVRTMLLHESGESITSDTRIVVKEQNSPQALGSAISYARRYGLSSMLSVGASDDDSELAMGRSQPATNLAAKVAVAEKKVISGEITMPDQYFNELNKQLEATTPAKSFRKPKVVTEKSPDNLDDWT